MTCIANCPLPQVGRGSFAQAFEAIDTRTGGGVCAKKLPRYLHNKQPCQQAAAVAAEASTLRALSAACPSIVRFLDVRQDSSFFYLITEVRGLLGIMGAEGA